MTQANDEHRDRLHVLADVAVSVQRLANEGNEVAAVEAAKKLLAVSPEEVIKSACSEELEIRCISHEIISDLMTELIFSDSHDGAFWRKVVLPTATGVLGYPIWMGNARWLRLYQSERCGQSPYELDPRSLEALGFLGQAKMLGRYCVTSDATSTLDFAAVREVLDERLLPFFTSWFLGIYMQSPLHLQSEEVAAFQASAMESFLASWRKKPMRISSSLMELTTSFQVAYREDLNVKGVIQVVRGNLMRDLFGNMRPKLPKGTAADIRTELRPLVTAQSAVLCPNWRDSHVAYRCLEGPTRSMLEAGDLAILIHEPGSPNKGSCAEAWKPQHVEVNLTGESHYIHELGAIANEIEAAKLDFLFYPEISPTNCTAWFGTQRLARVQATGYGFPITTGSASMDYFIGGSEVERDGSDYCEQLVLLPGLGVSTTTPPVCETKRTRGFDEEDLRVVSIATHHKLGANLVRSWEAILGDKPNASMDLFPGMSPNQAKQILPSMATHLQHAQIDLHPRVERQEILASLEEADLYLDTFPFGGFNSLVEVLVAGCPVVTLEGKFARNRFGAAMLRRLELPEFLIAKNQDEFIAAARRLLGDAGLRMEIRAQIGSRERVLEALADPHIHEHFQAAVMWMRERGPRTGKNARPGAPVLIQAGETPRLISA